MAELVQNCYGRECYRFATQIEAEPDFLTLCSVRETSPDIARACFTRTNTAFPKKHMGNMLKVSILHI